MSRCGRVVSERDNSFVALVRNAFRRLLLCYLLTMVVSRVLYDELCGVTDMCNACQVRAVQQAVGIAQDLMSNAFHPDRSSKVNQDENNTIIKLQGVNDKSSTEFYLGKRLAYIYKAKTKENGTRFRVMWGRIARPHGTNGAVRAKFTKNLPAKALGAAVRVFLFPSRV